MVLEVAGTQIHAKYIYSLLSMFTLYCACFILKVHIYRRTGKEIVLPSSFIQSLPDTIIDFEFWYKTYF